MPCGGGSTADRVNRGGARSALTWSRAFPARFSLRARWPAFGSLLLAAGVVADRLGADTALVPPALTAAVVVAAGMAHTASTHRGALRD